MKTMRLGKYFPSIAIMAFLLFSTGNAFGLNAARDCYPKCTYANNFVVVSPYWQVDSGSYTFIAVTHSSLSGMASQIGVHVNALTSTGSAYSTAASFTVSAGSTERLFVVPSTHATINSTAIPTAKFIAGTSDFTHGTIRANPVMTSPNLKYTTQAGNGVGQKIFIGDGFRDITMLSYWGSVIIEANTTGFAMEFIGDMNDSTAHYNASHNFQEEDCDGSESAPQLAYQRCGQSDTTAAGIAGRTNYERMHTGPNLQ